MNILYTALVGPNNSKTLVDLKNQLCSFLNKSQQVSPAAVENVMDEQSAEQAAADGLSIIWTHQTQRVLLLGARAGRQDEIVCVFQIK